MKKNISINIGGIIFHVEEEGYEKLKSYLDKINSYFANFQDNQEIVNDIENRIAEIFLSKLKDDKQVINLEDVESLISSLGSISDFEAAEKINEPLDEAYNHSEKEGAEDTSEKRLFRDTQRGIFGGVAAGIAHYFNLDPLWIRLALIIATTGTIFFGGFGLIIVLAYLIMWVAIPANPFLTETKNIKKLYRSKDGNVIAGVAKGLSIYLGVDVAIIRLLFVIALFTGSGILIYIVLWIITPKANSLTEKMEMEGTPITLKNIEKNIKANFNVKEGEESTLVRILLFPFRLIALILNGLAKILGPVLNVIVDIFRILLGISLVIGGLFSGLVAFIFASFSMGWLIERDIMQGLDIPLNALANTITPEITIVGLFLMIIPAIFIIICGISVLLKRWMLNKTIGLTILGLYILTIIATIILGFRTALEFNQKAEVIETTQYQIPDSSTIHFSTLNRGIEKYEHPDIYFKGYEGTDILIERKYSARGKTLTDAENNAKTIISEIELSTDSTISISKYIDLHHEAKLRDQELDIIINIPYGKSFKVDNYLTRSLAGQISRGKYSWKSASSRIWVFNPQRLECSNCDESLRTEENTSVSIEDDLDFYKKPFELTDDFESISYNLSNFNNLSVSNAIFLEVIESNEYHIEVYSNDDDLDNIQVRQSGSNLRLTYNSNDWEWIGHKVKVIVYMPSLDEIKASSSATVHIKGFNTDNFHVDMSSSARVYIAGNYESLSIDASSASKAYLMGSGKRLDINASSSASIRAKEYVAEVVKASVSSAASADIFAVNELTADASSAGSINYAGNAEVNSNSSSGGRVRKK